MLWFRYLARVRTIKSEGGSVKREFIPAGWLKLDVDNEEALVEFTRGGAFTATCTAGDLKGVILDLTHTPLLEEPLQ